MKSFEAFLAYFLISIGAILHSTSTVYPTLNRNAQCIKSEFFYMYINTYSAIKALCSCCLPNLPDEYVNVLMHKKERKFKTSLQYEHKSNRYRITL